jgi:hypothetical protein
VDEISCETRGLHLSGSKLSNNNFDSKNPNIPGMRTLKIDGWDYKVPKSCLADFLPNNWEIVSDKVKNMNLNKDVPKLLLSKDKQLGNPKEMSKLL